jgi:hypothetical protein
MTEYRGDCSRRASSTRNALGSVTCEAIADGLCCDTKIPRDRHRDASSMQFRITQGGTRLRWDYSLPSGHVSREGIETEISKFTSLAAPELADER